MKKRSVKFICDLCGREKLTESKVTEMTLKVEHPPGWVSIECHYGRFADICDICSEKVHEATRRRSNHKMHEMTKEERDPIAP